MQLTLPLKSVEWKWSVGVAEISGPRHDSLCWKHSFDECLIERVAVNDTWAGTANKQVRATVNLIKVRKLAAWTAKRKERKDLTERNGRDLNGQVRIFSAPLQNNVRHHPVIFFFSSGRRKCFIRSRFRSANQQMIIVVIKSSARSSSKVPNDFLVAKSLHYWPRWSGRLPVSASITSSPF